MAATNPLLPHLPSPPPGAKAEEREPMTPSEVWLALTAIPRPTREVPLPRCIPGTSQPVGHIVMWPLTQEEQMAANADADRFTKALLKDPQKKEEANLGYQHTFTNEVAVQVLHRACRDPKSENFARPAFPSPKLMRQHLSTDEIGVLFSQYCTVQAELGPIRAFMSKEEHEALILRIAEGGSAFPFDSLSWEQQRTLVLSMASQLARCWTAMSSAGLPLDVSTFVVELLQEKAKAKEAPPAEELEQPSDRSDADDGADILLNEPPLNEG